MARWLLAVCLIRSVWPSDKHSTENLLFSSHLSKPTKILFLGAVVV